MSFQEISLIFDLANDASSIRGLKEEEIMFLSKLYYSCTDGQRRELLKGKRYDLRQWFM